MIKVTHLEDVLSGIFAVSVQISQGSQTVLTLIKNTVIRMNLHIPLWEFGT